VDDNMGHAWEYVLHVVLVLL